MTTRYDILTGRAPGPRIVKIGWSNVFDDTPEGEEFRKAVIVRFLAEQPESALLEIGKLLCRNELWLEIAPPAESEKLKSLTSYKVPIIKRKESV